ncbi:MAG: PAS domain S-box protein, partial [Deltaproteobacteria bacterium]|nr:PAS domain S-box protein [Deltaproteobacteria bacterium]
MKPRINLSPTPAAGSDPTSPEAIVRVVLEKSPLLVYIANLDFKIVLANRSLRDVTGYDTSDTPSVNALVSRFYPHGPDYKQRVLDIHEGWKRNEHVMGAKLLVQCKDGTQRTIAWYTSRLRIGRGPTVGYLAMGLDLTTQGTLEQWVSLLQRTLQHLNEGVILSDPSGGVLAWNEGATRLLGYSEGEMQGQSIHELLPAKQRDALMQEIDDAIEGPSNRFADEIGLARKGGGIRELSMVQLRLDGEGGAPLARLTVLAPPESDADELFAQTAGLEGQLKKLASENKNLVAEQGRLAAKVSTMDAELATSGAAAGQIADLRGQLDQALDAAASAKARVAELEAKSAAPPADVKATDGDKAAASSEDAVAIDDDEPPTAKPGEVAEAARSAELDARKADLAAAKAELEAAKAELEAAKAELDSSKAELASATAALTATKEELESALAALETSKVEAQAGKAELEAAVASAETNATELAALAAQLSAAQAASEGVDALIEQAQQDLDDQKESWVLERSKLEDEHRALLDAANQKATEQRRALEAQLHKDILAAEERAEVERQKLIEAFATEKTDIAQAADIAQAELESRASRAMDDLKRTLESVPKVQPHLEPVSAALVSADSTGKVVGWSSGAAKAEGSTAEAALGKVIFDEVLKLKGIKWKSIFGQVMVAGAVDRQVTLLRADGSNKEVQLHARIVKSDSGAPVGVTVELEEPRVEPDAQSRADAAMQRLLSPFRAQLASQVGQAFQSLQGTLNRLQQLERLGQGGTPLPLDGLVAQVASATGGQSVCELGSQHEIDTNGRGLAALLFALVDGQQSAVVSTVGSSPVVVRGAQWTASQRGSLVWLAAEGGLGLSFVDGEAHVELTAPVPTPPPSSGAPTDDEATAIYDGPPADAGALRAEHATTVLGEVDAMDLELDEPEEGLNLAGSDESDLELDSDDDNPDLVRSGRVQFVGAEDGELEVFAGEDSVVKSHDAIYMKVNHLAEIDPVLRTSEQILARAGEMGPTSSTSLPPLDELDELPSASGTVSADLLNTANQMDAYVAGNTVADDELEDSESAATGPSQAVLDEMSSTDVDGDKLG